MRLLSCDGRNQLRLTWFDQDDLPPYAILSHTWGEQEVTYQDVISGDGRDHKGYQKLDFCLRQATKDGLQYCWVDTCCINKENLAELSEAINSMFRWYQRAKKCYVYLADVPQESIRSSRWFTRGWTLQELLAPSKVEFFSATAAFLGDKQSLESDIHERTKIPIKALRGQSLAEFGIDERLSWITGRQTKREEDMAYSLLGLFEISMPLIYGEGRDRAEFRLRRCIEESLIYTGKASTGAPSQVLDTERKELFQCLSSDYRRQKDSNPERVEGTCEWFVQDVRFIDWRDSQKSCLLHVFAGPGCGKSVLARHLIDSEILKASDSATVLYFFFKSAQEGQEKSVDALAAMLHQLYTQKQSEGMVVHALSRFKAYGNKLSTMFGELWDILERTIEDPTAGEIICVFDALDECLEQDRGTLLTAMTRYFEYVAPKQESGGRLKVLMTSRPYEDIGIKYDRLGDEALVVQLDGNDKSELIAKEINLVIEYSVPRSLPKVPEALQRMVVQQLQSMENRTYLWLHLILDHVEKNSAGKHTSRKINKLIATLPATVNEAYQEMLRRSKDPEQARTLLHLVVAAKRPLTVAELKIAAALVEDEEEYESYEELYGNTETAKEFKDSLQNICGLILSVHDSRVYLIHQTAREYLCSEQFEVGSGQKRWQGPITEPEADALAARSCVSLLSLKDFSEPQPWKGRSLQWYEVGHHIDEWVRQYDLLEYAAIYWASHNRYKERIEGESEPRQEIRLCAPDSDPFWAWYPIFCKNGYRDLSDKFNGLVFSSSIGNEMLVGSFLLRGADVNSYDEWDGNALQAASFGGHDKIVQLLLDRGAEVNAQGGLYGNAL